MSRVTVATFVIGFDAAKRVEHQLALSGEYLAARSCRMDGDRLENIAARFDRLMSSSPDGFETECPLWDSQPLRVICSLRQRTAGLLYVVQSNHLKTVSVLVSGIDIRADVSAIEELGQKLSAIDAYYESLAIVRFAARPMLATFCSSGGGINRNIDCIHLAFAAVFFHRCGLTPTHVHEADRNTRADREWILNKSRLAISCAS